MTKIDYDRVGREVRLAIVRALAAARRGHVGAAFSIVEILNVLFEAVLRFDPRRPDWAERDRLILSKGHGCLALYAILAKKGFFPEEELDRFCQPGGILGGHPDARKVPGVESSTGSLGHGLSVGIGMALALRVAKNPARVFVILGDGECNEGSIWEGALSAAKHRLDRLTVLVDYNRMQSYAPASEVLDMEPMTEKWQSFGFDVRPADLDRPEELESLLSQEAWAKAKPRAVICKTTKGKGVPFVENNLEWHHKNKVTDDDLRLLREALGNA